MDRGWSPICTNTFPTSKITTQEIPDLRGKNAKRVPISRSPEIRIHGLLSVKVCGPEFFHEISQQSNLPTSKSDAINTLEMNGTLAKSRRVGFFVFLFLDVEKGASPWLGRSVENVERV